MEHFKENANDIGELDDPKEREARISKNKWVTWNSETDEKRK